MGKIRSGLCSHDATSCLIWQSWRLLDYITRFNIDPKTTNFEKSSGDLYSGGEEKKRQRRGYSKIPVMQGRELCILRSRLAWRIFPSADESETLMAKEASRNPCKLLQDYAEAPAHV